MRAHNLRHLAEEEVQRLRAAAIEAWRTAGTPEERQAARRLMDEADAAEEHAQSLPSTEYFCSVCHQTKNSLQKVIKTIAGYSRFDNEGENVEQVTFLPDQMRTEYVCPGCDKNGQVTEYLGVESFSADLTVKFPPKRIVRK